MSPTRSFSVRSCPVKQLANGRVRVRSRGRLMRYMCLEGYTLVGNKYSTCVRGQWDTPTPVCVSAGCSIPPKPDNSMMIPKFGGAILMFFCEPNYSLIGSAEIYCDGRQWNGTIPYCRDTNATTPTKCDFESPDLCWWEQDPLHDFDWTRHNFETPSLHIGTGPTHDHTLGAGNDGHYLYIEASGRLVNDTARIISPLYKSSLTESGCFSFWYHMFGIWIGSLNVYFKQEDTEKRDLIFTKSGNQGNRWFHGISELPKANASFQIIIEGVRGNTYESDIAIDDVAILHGDECIATNESAITVGYDDQIEIVNAQQTCRDRCVSSESIVPSAPPFGPESCLCTIDCAERSICCPDYAEYCILGQVYTEYESYSTMLYNSTMESPSKTLTIAPMKNSTLPGFLIPINPKDDIDPGMTTLTITRRTTTTTQRPTTTTRRTTTTTVKTRTRKPSWKTTPVKPTQQGTEETPFIHQLHLTTVELLPRSDLPDVERSPEKVKQGRGIEILEIVIAVGATLFVLSVALVIAIFVIRRRKTYKRGANGSALSEDSDVRFLTSDEILDFNLARPTDNDEM